MDAEEEDFAGGVGGIGLGELVVWCSVASVLDLVKRGQIEKTIIIINIIIINNRMESVWK